MSIPVAIPTRKQRFAAALRLAGLTEIEWCRAHDVTVSHVNYVLRGVNAPGGRPGGRVLNAAIDEVIRIYLPLLADAPTRRPDKRPRSRRSA